MPGGAAQTPPEGESGAAAMADVPRERERQRGRAQGPIGVLALQGDFAAHARALEADGDEIRLVRVPADLDGLAGIVLPGGESTTQLRLLASSKLRAPLAAAIRDGLPALATCAGLILLARRVTEPDQESLDLLDVTVARNAWGRQLDSFEASSDRGRLPLVFIRAPRIRATGAGVEVLDTFDGEPILVRQRSIVAATFHPELAGDPSAARLAFGGPEVAEIDAVRHDFAAARHD